MPEPGLPEDTSTRGSYPSSLGIKDTCRSPPLEAPNLGTLVELEMFLTEMPLPWEAPARLPELSWVQILNSRLWKAHRLRGKRTVRPVRSLTRGHTSGGWSSLLVPRMRTWRFREGKGPHSRSHSTLVLPVPDCGPLHLPAPPSL